MENTRSMTRRTFINRTALGVAAVALTPFNSLIAADPQSTWAKNASKYNMIMIGHGHIDPVWLWRWQEGVAVVHSTFRSALDRMKENPDMCFTASSAQFYQWIADNDPEMLKEIRQRVEEGRWNIVGGWWVEPDVNIPCGESLVRQGLYGQLTFQKLFNKRAKVAFNPDSFGHPGTLPQIIAKQGMDNYCFMRPAAHVRLESFGPVGYGKAGSCEGFCSGNGIAQLARTKVMEKIQQGIHVAFCPTIGEVSSLTAKVVAEAAMNGDPLAIEVYRICGAYLGRMLSMLIDILNPQVIVIGSIYVRSKDLIEPEMVRVIEKETLSYSRSVCKIVPAGLGEKIGDIAALSVASYLL